MMQQKIEIKRAAIYTRKSVEEGLEQEFNSLDAQREAGEAYVKSQKANGWVLLPDRYDDGGFSGGNLNRPALKRLMSDCEAGKVDIIVVYKIDRLSRSICDFAELSRQLDRMNVAFVSVTQEINTHTSAGRMMLNILLTFAQFEREVITERVRDKMRASRLKGKWVGGNAAYGYKVENHRLVPVPEELPILERIYRRFTEVQSTRQIAYELNNDGIPWRRGKAWTPQHIYRILTNVTYLGKVDNEEDGRNLFKADVISYLNLLQSIKCIQNFDSTTDIEVLPGNDIDAVVCNLWVQPVDSMEKLYMTVNVG